MPQNNIKKTKNEKLKIENEETDSKKLFIKKKRSKASRSRIKQVKSRKTIVDCHSKRRKPITVLPWQRISSGSAERKTKNPQATN